MAAYFNTGTRGNPANKTQESRTFMSAALKYWISGAVAPRNSLATKKLILYAHQDALPDERAGYTPPPKLPRPRRVMLRAR